MIQVWKPKHSATVIRLDSVFALQMNRPRPPGRHIFGFVKFCSEYLIFRERAITCQPVA